MLSNPSIRQSGIEFAAVFVLSLLSASQGGICWSGNCCAFLSLYLIQQSHHLGCTAPCFLSQWGPKLSWQGRKERGENRETRSQFSSQSPGQQRIRFIPLFIHSSVVYQPTKALERKIREMGLWWNGQELRVYYGNSLFNAVWYSVSANLYVAVCLAAHVCTHTSTQKYGSPFPPVKKKKKDENKQKKVIMR